jgi:hypothetical protein
MNKRYFRTGDRILPTNQYQGQTYLIWIYKGQLLFAKVTCIQIQKGVSGRVRSAGILLCGEVGHSNMKCYFVALKFSLF